MQNILYRALRSAYKKIQRVTGKYTVIGRFRLKVDPENSQPYIIKKYPEHGTALIRLARSVSSKYHGSPIIDIGANFGDTAAMLLSDSDGYKIYCIEGDDESFGLLENNLGTNESVELLKTFLSDADHTVTAHFDKKGGSLRLGHETDSGSASITSTKLDSLAKKHPELKGSKLLKIDTDGYDFRIMRGAAEYIDRTRPVIYFEYDKTYLLKAGENPLEIFEFLKGHGYDKLAFYDNFGRFLLSARTGDSSLLRQLDRYITSRGSAYQYYDVAAFHGQDADLADSFIKNEEGSS